MKLMILNPDYGMSREALALREERLGAVCHPGTTVHMRGITHTQVEIDSLTDVALASPELVAMAIRAEQEGYDAVILYCFSDPALAACREMLHIPVVGSGQAALMAANMLGYRFSILTTAAARNPEKYHFAYSNGIGSERLASVRSFTANHSDAERDRQDAVKAIAEAAQRCVTLDGADTVILGCLSFAGLANKISDVVGVPVVDPAYAGVLAAQSLVQMGLSHSKTAYPYPPSYQKHYSAVPAQFQ